MKDTDKNKFSNTNTKFNKQQQKYTKIIKLKIWKILINSQKAFRCRRPHINQIRICEFQENIFGFHKIE